MRLLERINRTGTTVVMATHDERIVDQMRKRVVELEHGKVVRDQERGVYGAGIRPRPRGGALLGRSIPYGGMLRWLHSRGADARIHRQQAGLQLRLRRIEGQVRGLQRMVDEDAYCIDVLTQISAATKALSRSLSNCWTTTWATACARRSPAAVRTPRPRSPRPRPPSPGSYEPELPVRCRLRP